MKISTINHATSPGTSVLSQKLPAYRSVLPVLTLNLDFQIAQADRELSQMKAAHNSQTFFRHCGDLSL